MSTRAINDDEKPSSTCERLVEIRVEVDEDCPRAGPLYEAHWTTPHGVVTQSWCPLVAAGSTTPVSPMPPYRPLERPGDHRSGSCARQYPAQVVSTGHLQHGLSVIPKPVRKERIAENIDVLDVDVHLKGRTP